MQTLLRLIGLSAVLAALTLAAACGSGASAESDDGASDGDTDADTDVDTDADSDTDADGDGDGDTDTDSDADGGGDGDTDADSDTGTGELCIDEDEDWWCVPLDCVDSDSSIHPDVTEDTDNGVDDDCDGLTDEEDGDTSTDYVGPTIPTTCAQAAIATTTVGCQFYAADLDGFDSSETSLQFAVGVSNVQEIASASVEVYQGSSSGWTLLDSATVSPMDFHTFNLPEYHQESSGLKADGSYKIESDVPIIAYQFNPIDGAISYSSDASMLIPVTSLSETYDIIGYRETSRLTYFSIIAVSDGTQVTISPSVTPTAGGPVPASTTPFTVDMDDGDLLEVATGVSGQSLTGSRIESNDGHPIAVFTAHECADIPSGVSFCDHLEEQMPGLRFWGTEFVAARIPPRSGTTATDSVLWQIYASEDDTTISLTADAAVTGLPASPFTLDAGEKTEFYAAGPSSNPGDFHISADKPIGVMQYMTGSQNPYGSSIGDPAAVYLSPVEQFLPRYVVLVPPNWVNDKLVITRTAGAEVLLNDTPISDSEFIEVASSGYEVARLVAPDGVYAIASTDGVSGLAVIVVGYDTHDSYAYAGGMGLAAINPGVD